MAQIIVNKKKFKVIEVSFDEVQQKFGGLGICDWCNDIFENCFYIAVLNHCYCQKCYDSWLKRAVNYKQDHQFENKMFKLRKEQLDL